ISVLDITKAGNAAVSRPEILVSVNNTKGLITFHPTVQKQTQPVQQPPLKVVPMPAQQSPTSPFEIPTAFRPVAAPVQSPPPTPQLAVQKTLPEIELESPATEKFHVLVIDDDPATCNLITRALRQDCNVTAVNDGASGLKKLSDNTYDLIILDVNL